MKRTVAALVCASALAAAGAASTVSAPAAQAAGTKCNFVIDANVSMRQERLKNVTCQMGYAARARLYFTSKNGATRYSTAGGWALYNATTPYITFSSSYLWSLASYDEGYGYY